MAEVDLIVKWQQTVSPETDTNEPPIIAHLYKACSELYSGILAKLNNDQSIDKSILLSLQRSHSYLVLWADGYGVSDGLLPIIAHNQHNQRVQLDAKAAAVHDAADKLKYLTQQDETEDTDSDTSSEASSVCGSTELDEIAEDLKTDAQCLLDLGSRFDERVVRPVSTEKAVDPSQISTWDPSRNFIDRIRWRYPQCDADLTKRLGKANWARVLKFQETKNLNSRKRQSPESKSAADVATNTGSSKVASTTFHDSGLGSSVPSGLAVSQYAETVVSYYGGQGDSVRIPPLPEEAKKGSPFLCVCCDRIVTMTKKSAWKKHLFSDLEPYICLEGKCDFNRTPFLTKLEWENHLTLDHNYSREVENFTCLICQERSFGGIVHVTAHLARHLEEIALTILPTNPDSEDGTDDDSGLASSEASSQDEGSKGALEAMWPQKEEIDGITDAIDRIQSNIFDRLLKMDDFKAFHSMISRTREKMHIGIVLRDIETTLIFDAQARDPRPELYQEFGLAVLDTIRDTIPFVKESSHIQPGERPYDEEYLRDAKKQIRRHARRMNDEIAGEHPKPIPSLVGNKKGSGTDSGPQSHTNTVGNELGIMKTMPRRKIDRNFQEPQMCEEPGCQKVFRRPCDLKKHERTHTRPWKCPVLICKYHEYGWPTEKEKDRHVNDKHSGTPAMFECHFQPCPYKSKRESNCKQHMEKAHGWTYVRPKINIHRNYPDGASPGTSPFPSDLTFSRGAHGSSSADREAVAPYSLNESPGFYDELPVLPDYWIQDTSGPEGQFNDASSSFFPPEGDSITEFLLPHSPLYSAPELQPDRYTSPQYPFPDYNFGPTGEEEENLQVHLRTHEGFHNPTLHGCEHCDKRFVGLEYPNSHVDRNHRT
ncbi:hypothetical protein AAE478_008822 [Parahypoxylon ruwenzoriense]